MNRTAGGFHLQSDAMLRGGRVTKVAGQAASYSPDLGLAILSEETAQGSPAQAASSPRSLLRWSVAPLALAAVLAVSAPEAAQAQAIPVECTVDITPISAASTITCTSTTPIVGAVDGLTIPSTPASIVVEDIESVTGTTGDGLDLRSSGDITVNAVDTITGTGGLGIRANRTRGPGSISIQGSGLVGGISAQQTAIFADGSGNINIGGVTPLGDITSAGGDGIVIFTIGDATVNTGGSIVAGGGRGISVRATDGNVDITTGGDVVTTSTSFSTSIRVDGSRDVTINTTAGELRSATRGSHDGIVLDDMNSGNVSITTGDITTTVDGLRAPLVANRNTVAIDTTAGTVRTGRTGILAFGGSGTLTIDTADIIVGGISGVTESIGVFAVTNGGTVQVNTTRGRISTQTSTAIEVSDNSSGSISIVTGDVSGSTGIDVESRGGTIALDSTAGSVTGSGASGIIATNIGAGVINLTVGEVTGGARGIVTSSGSGATSIRLASTALVTGLGGAGIDARSTGGPISVTGSSGDVVGTPDGIYSRSGGGAILIDNLDSVTGTAGDGLDLGSAGGDITVNAVDTITGTGGNGVLADSDGGDIIITGSGTVGGITGTAGHGVYADARGGPGGAITISGNGDITGSLDGIRALTDGAGSIAIDSSSGRVTGGTNGILAFNDGTGATTITTGAVTGTTGSGIRARSSDGGLTVDSSAGLVTGGFDGIYALDLGEGDVSVTTAGVTGTGGIGIVAVSGFGNVSVQGSGAGDIFASGAGGNQLVNGVNVSGAAGSGIFAYSSTGNIEIGTTGVIGNVTSVNGAGIFAQNSSGSISVDSSAGAVTGGTAGILARSDSGDIVADVDQVTGGAQGIITSSGTGATSISLASTALVTGLGGAGIDARSTGSSISVTGNSGDVVGATDGMFVRSGGGDILIDNLDSVTGNAGDGLDLGSSGGDITVNA
ncbi:MAG: hypothetical protein KDD98_09360, partial [Sphingomonadaceae bacterium]|nr:hypothetical protein [Sphingomonadaceae bacterium]